MHENENNIGYSPPQWLYSKYEWRFNIGKCGKILKLVKFHFMFDIFTDLTDNTREKWTRLIVNKHLNKQLQATKLTNIFFNVWSALPKLNSLYPFSVLSKPRSSGFNTILVRFRAFVTQSNLRINFRRFKSRNCLLSNPNLNISQY